MYKIQYASLITMFHLLPTTYYCTIVLVIGERLNYITTYRDAIIAYHIFYWNCVNNDYNDYNDTQTDQSTNEPTGITTDRNAIAAKTNHPQWLYLTILQQPLKFVVRVAITVKILLCTLSYYS